MAKSSTKSSGKQPGKNDEAATTNASFAKKKNPLPAFSPLNSSRYAFTGDVNEAVQSLGATDGLRELLYEGLKGMYWSEIHLTDALPKMLAAASGAKLRKAIKDHLAETAIHVQRLEEIFEMIGRTPKAKKCAAMEGLTIDGESVIENTDAGSAARDLGIIMAGDKVEHYEIAAYTGLQKLAAGLGLGDVAELLQNTLQEEQASSALLSGIADNDPLFSSAFNEDAEA